ncbi:hypothetical protein [Streptomyces sp. NPDC050546]|uniref:hypothetical protein n=1 Tax=Streptomyces sp. NPDC050546 TaxID=3365628 RepID=UPI00379F23C2
MADKPIETPEPGATPFRLLEEASTWTLAGRIIGLALQLCGGSECLREAPDDMALMELPDNEVKDLKELVDCFTESSHYLDFSDLSVDQDEPLLIPEHSAKLENLYSSYIKGDPSAALSLMRACLKHPHPVVRTAAAASLHPLRSTDELIFYFPKSEAQLVESILKQASWNPDPAIREMALTVTGAAGPQPIAGSSGRTRRDRQRGRASIIVHGTRAYKGDWWRPRGVFYEYLANGPKSNLINDECPWSWSGELDAKVRRMAARSLAGFQRDRNIRKFDTIIGHSYGGGIALMATQFGAKARNIILLSTPALDYEPNWDNVDEVKSLRIHWENVLMLDCLNRIIRIKKPPIRQRFSDARIHEIPTLPLWFREHSSTHDPSVWVANSIPELIWPD